MKRIIDGKTYNTETATQVGPDYYFRPEDPVEFERLYQNRHGAYFLHRCSEEWVEPVGSFLKLDHIEPLTPAEAQGWMEEHLAGIPELVEAHFGEMPEAGQGESRFTLRLPDVLKHRIDALAKSSGQSTNAWVTRCLERCAAAQEQGEGQSES